MSIRSATARLGAIVAGAMLLCATTANAGLIINIVEAGGNVQASYSGTFNLNATQGLVGNATGFDGYLATGGNLSFTMANSDVYWIDVGIWTPFGTGAIGSWDTSIGDALHLFGDPLLGLPVGYAGSAISGSATKNSASFASLGFTPGSYTTTITNGNVSDTVTVNVVPEPETLALFGLGLAGLGFARRRKAA